MGKEIQMRGIVLGRGIPAICVPLVAPDKHELKKQARAARQSAADIVEWRVDSFEDKSSTSILKGLMDVAEVLEPIPLLFTLRTAEEGGSTYEAAWKEYADTNMVAAKSGMVDLVDIEALHFGRRAKKLIGEIQAEGVKTIASHHDFEKTPEDEELARQLNSLYNTGADLVKLAVMPRSPEDVQRLMNAVHAFALEYDVPVIGIAMGDLGRESRILGEKYGSCMTFGVVEHSSAPGQLAVDELKEALRNVHASLLE